MECFTGLMCSASVFTAIRTKEYQNRLFWEKDSHIPTHGRGKNDGFMYATALALTAGSVGISVKCIYDFLHAK
ncbi:hypothetical protein QVD99_001118 [Batrachochytrium dendrobatidis]|nr:hypothetical protein QVD99_001118 [Batrachochytrium dendrobatidis]